MTQAYNLAILANAVDTSGRLNVGTNATGTLPVANGGTGTSTPSLIAGTGITITGSFPNQTVASSGGAGTVTSVATGNGLQGGTITTSGTLSVACPGFNTVGSYCFARCTGSSGSQPAAGSNYGTGFGNNQIAAIYLEISTPSTDAPSVQISGTWKWMGASNNGVGVPCIAIACRVS